MRNVPKRGRRRGTRDDAYFVKLQGSGKVAKPFVTFIRLVQDENGKRVHDLVHIGCTSEYITQWPGLYLQVIPEDGLPAAAEHWADGTGNRPLRHDEWMTAAGQDADLKPLN
ncbi:unnamed protein product [Clonostachys solani]|uniref:Uncharacterized protein n=1 Tax=Clonostachys solani TaxID=160281 RepID=A0A9N9Z719_9HYPO|nr:unnamed protein product [Clonostachys solani]